MMKMRLQESGSLRGLSKKVVLLHLIENVMLYGVYHLVIYMRELRWWNMEKPRIYKKHGFWYCSTKQPSERFRNTEAWYIWLHCIGCSYDSPFKAYVQWRGLVGSCLELYKLPRPVFKLL